MKRNDLWTNVLTGMLAVAWLVSAPSASAAPPPKDPPPNPDGVIYFLKAGQVWQMNGNGSGKAPALPADWRGRPSSCLYDGTRWWLYPKGMDVGGATLYELYAFRFHPDGSGIQEVQLTDIVKDGYSLSWSWEPIQWSNDGIDSFCSVIVYTPENEKCLYRFVVDPLTLESATPMTIAEGELVLRETDPDDFDLTDWFLEDYSWSPDGTKIAYVNAHYAKDDYKLRIKTVAEGTTTEVPVTPTKKIEKLTNLSWSPNGERICFYAWLNLGRRSLNTGDWTVRLDGTSLTQLFSGYSGYNDGKKWSPDSLWVTYENTENTRIDLIAPDKSKGPYNLTSDLSATEKKEVVDWVSDVDWLSNVTLP